eukprot:sb/3478063/
MSRAPISNYSVENLIRFPLVRPKSNMADSQLWKPPRNLLRADLTRRTSFRAMYFLRTNTYKLPCLIRICSNPLIFCFIKFHAVCFVSGGVSIIIPAGTSDTVN